MIQEPRELKMHGWGQNQLHSFEVKFNKYFNKNNDYLRKSNFSDCF